MHLCHSRKLCNCSDCTTGMRTIINAVRHHRVCVEFVRGGRPKCVRTSCTLCDDATHPNVVWRQSRGAVTFCESRCAPMNTRSLAHKLLDVAKVLLVSSSNQCFAKPRDTRAATCELTPQCQYLPICATCRRGLSIDSSRDVLQISS